MRKNALVQRTAITVLIIAFSVGLRTAAQDCPRGYTQDDSPQWCNLTSTPPSCTRCEDNWGNNGGATTAGIQYSGTVTQHIVSDSQGYWVDQSQTTCSRTTPCVQSAPRPNQRCFAACAAGNSGVCTQWSVGTPDPWTYWWDAWYCS